MLGVRFQLECAFLYRNYTVECVLVSLTGPIIDHQLIIYEELSKLKASSSEAINNKVVRYLCSPINNQLKFERAVIRSRFQITS
jgi:hypothetical protein